MNKEIYRIIGGILQILAGAIWLTVVITIKKVLGIGYTEMVCAIILIIIGIIVCSNKFKEKNAVIVFGIIDLLLIFVQFFYKSYIGIGIIPMVLLLISAILFFISKPDKNDKDNDNENDKDNKE